MTEAATVHVVNAAVVEGVKKGAHRASIFEHPERPSVVLPERIPLRQPLFRVVRVCKDLYVPTVDMVRRPKGDVGALTVPHLWVPVYRLRPRERLYPPTDSFHAFSVE